VGQRVCDELLSYRTCEIGLSFAYEYGGAPSCDFSSPSGVITICVSAAPGGDPNAGGVFRYQFTADSHITRAYIQVRPGASQKVYVHEMGHAVRLRDRTNFVTSVMNDPADASNGLPNQHDLDGSRNANSGHH
jgi:hypothetical protein